TESMKKQANMAIHQTEAGLEQAKVALSQTYWNGESMKQGAKSQIDSAEKAIELSEKKIASTNASLNMAQEAYENATLKAPFDGEVIGVYQKVGEMISPGMPVIYFGTSDDLKIVADVDEEDISMINEGQGVEKYYAGKATNLDFVNETEKSRKTINSWVEDKTNNKIKDLIPQGVLDPDTRLVLTNAIYFKGTWLLQFNKEDTREEDFKVIKNPQYKI
ncbi:unnamed protein product, partial [marine sediment metagenome]